MKRTAMIFAFVIGIAGLTISCNGTGNKKAQEDSTSIGQKTETFDDIINGSTPVIVDFYATWCKPCKIQAPIIEEIQNELGNKVRVVKVDVDVEEDLANRYGIQSIPTIMIFKGGKTLFNAVGVQQKETLTKVVMDAQ